MTSNVSEFSKQEKLLTFCCFKMHLFLHSEYFFYGNNGTLVPYLTDYNNNINHPSPISHLSFFFNFKKCNFYDLSLFLSNIDFDLNLNQDLSLDALIITFYGIIYYLFSLFVSQTIIYNNYFSIWANAELISFTIKNNLTHKNINFILLLLIM